MGFCPFCSAQHNWPCPEDTSCALWDSGCVFNRIAANPGGTPTQEFFVPVTQGTDMTAHNEFPGALINATIDVARIAFYVPHDFSAMDEVVVTRICTSGATRRLNYVSTYGVVGASHRTHNESLLDQDTVETAHFLYEQDITGILSALAVDDYVGIEVEGDAVNTPSDLIIGVRFKYS